MNEIPKHIVDELAYEQWRQRVAETEWYEATFYAEFLDISISNFHCKNILVYKLDNEWYILPYQTQYELQGYSYPQKGKIQEIQMGYSWVGKRFLIDIPKLGIKKLIAELTSLNEPIHFTIIK